MTKIFILNLNLELQMDSLFDMSKAEFDLQFKKNVFRDAIESAFGSMRSHVNRISNLKWQNRQAKTL